MIMTQGLMRLKLPIQDLVEEILNQLPDHVWQDPTITFLDPAMAGGQFIRAIERRLLAAGHSRENIADRVYGCEEKLIRVKYVKNWHKVLSNQLHVMDFITHDWGNMKFDVIVGNPPYQSEKRTGTQPLWPLFVNKASEILSD
jgi:type I restriction-modification system DNA methylase subunit